MLEVLPKARLILIQLWFGKIPDYFKYHLATTKNLDGVDFLIVTDDLSLQVDAHNYKIINSTPSEIEELFYLKTSERIPVPYSKKICDFKIALADLFSEHCSSYEYVGFYDIDTLFSRMDRIKDAMLGDYAFITLADRLYADRLNGPLTILRNTKELRELYKRADFLAELKRPEITGPDEKSWSDLACREYRVKKIWACRNIDQKTNGLIEYYCKWKNGKLTSMSRDLEQYHFYNKDKTKFVQTDDDTIFAAYDKIVVNDFYWITGFTENYAHIGERLLRSILKHSNRPCIIYTIDFDWVLPDDLFASEQFLIRRFNLKKEGMDKSDRNSYMNAKPLYLIDAIDFLPNAKFAYIDADSSITASADFFLKERVKDLDNYPLINSHTHDDILVNVNGEWINSLRILLDQMNVERTVYPRRKTNLMLFDSSSLWFFNEQIKLFDEYANSHPNIFALHDEDSANAVLSKYQLANGLPVIDIEEVWDLDISKYSSYSYSVSENSKSSVLPSEPNQVVAFHQVKKQETFDQIDNYYGNSVICQDEILIRYENSSFVWQRNVPVVKQGIPRMLDFIIYDSRGNQLFKLANQEFREYWVFAVWQMPLSPGLYPTSIHDSNTGRILYSDILEIKGS